MKNILKLFGKIFIVLLTTILQGLFTIYLIKNMTPPASIFWIFSILLAFITILFISHQNLIPETKLLWSIWILLFPIFGILTYILTHRSKSFLALEKRIEEEEQQAKQYIKTDPKLIKKLKEQDKKIYSQINYFHNLGLSIYQNCDTKYYAYGQEVFKDILIALTEAKKFIFIEYFIISTSKILKELSKILKKKAADGVEVRILYDDIGSAFHLKEEDIQSLIKENIKIVSFYPKNSLLEPATDNRNHRKSLIVDGEVAFIGGINIADECLEETKKYGIWKDSSVKIKGPAVISITNMFLIMWNANLQTNSKTSYSPDKDYTSYQIKTKSYPKSGLVIPYIHNPLNKKNIASEVYLNIINQSTDYLYIYTPYLILDYTLKTSLILASKRGVEVKIITPGIPDKKLVYQVTRSYYYDLLTKGIQIYEYTPGFLHAKCMICDDEIATVGAINLDYRSLYTHFENGCYFYQGSIIKTIKQDFLKTIKVSQEIKKDNMTPSLPKIIWESILNLFATLL